MQGFWKKKGHEPELASEDKSSSDDEGDETLPVLPSSSGTTISSSKDKHMGVVDSQEGSLPTFKSNHPAFISAEVGEGTRQDVLGANFKVLSLVHKLALLSKRDEDVVEGRAMQTEVTSPPTPPTSGS